MSLVACEPKRAEDHKALLRVHEEIAHVTVEVVACESGGTRDEQRLEPHAPTIIVERRGEGLPSSKC